MNATGLLFWVQENKTSEKFYKKLGFSVIRSDEEVSIVDLNGFTITLLNMRNDEEFNRDSLAGSKGKGMYVYIRVKDVDDFFISIKGKSIQPRTEPRDWPWGNREFIIKDPDGYKLCFWQPSV